MYLLKHVALLLQSDGCYDFPSWRSIDLYIRVIDLCFHNISAVYQKREMYVPLSKSCSLIPQVTKINYFATVRLGWLILFFWGAIPFLKAFHIFLKMNGVCVKYNTVSVILHLGGSLQHQPPHQGMRLRSSHLCLIHHCQHWECLDAEYILMTLLFHPTAEFSSYKTLNAPICTTPLFVWVQRAFVSNSSQLNGKACQLMVVFLC